MIKKSKGGTVYCVIFKNEQGKRTKFEELEVLEVPETIEELSELLGIKAERIEDFSCNDYRYFTKYKDAENFLEKYCIGIDVFNSLEKTKKEPLPVLMFMRHNFPEMLTGQKTYTTRNAVSKSIQNTEYFYASDRTYFIKFKKTKLEYIDGHYVVHFARS